MGFGATSCTAWGERRGGVVARDGEITLAPSVRPARRGNPRWGTSARIALRPVLHEGRVKLDRGRVAATPPRRPQVEPLDQDREAHGGVDVVLRDVEAQAV